MATATEPPVKKTKKTENIDEFIDNVINSDKNLLPVMNDVLSGPIPFIKCYAGHVKNMKQLSTIIQILNEKLPLRDLSHLKRVFRNSVLLCPVNYLRNIHCESIQDYMDEHIPELKNWFEYFRDVEVPSKVPMTKKQNIECTKKWGCVFHPNKYIEEMMSDSCFKQTDLSTHRTHMGMAFYVARICLSKKDYTPCLQDLYFSNVNAAVVVDPTKKSVVTIAFDNRQDHPVQHATMLAIDNVARTQNGGAWVTNEEWMRQLSLKVRRKFHQATFGARQYISKKEATEDSKVDDSPYLCTGYDLYLIREPCLMCAMGLVHARIKRVFYAFENKDQGALRTKTKLHCVPSLNHRFEVFTGFIQ